MGAMVNVNGTIVSPEKALISVFDRGFLFGDGVYETVRTYGGRPFLLGRHLDRLQRSAEGLWLPVPGGIDGVKRETLRTLEASGNRESYLRIMVTRGAKDGFVDLDSKTAGESTLVIILRDLESYDSRCHDEGVVIAVVGVLRTGRRSMDPKIKSGNYLNNIMALHAAKKVGAFECLMPNREGDLTEGSTSNFFLVQDGGLVTPTLDSGLLDGITRSYVMELAEELGIRVTEKRVGMAELVASDEAFLTSSLKEVMPVNRVVDVDGVELWTGKVGPVTRDLRERYREFALKE